MNPEFLAPLVPITAIVAFTLYKLAKLRADRWGLPSAAVSAGLVAVERDVQQLQDELAETQERLDFAERLLSQARDARQISP